MLDEILFNKRQEVTSLKVKAKLENYKKKVKTLPATRDFLGVLQKEELSLIAEIKKASPSAGVIREDFDPVQLAKAYEENGAAAISVITDEKFFQGNLEHLKLAKETTSLPILKKDFVIDEDQIYEARIAGADAILLITSLLTDEQLKEFIKLAQYLDLDPMVEVHAEEELERALKTKAKIIGINNRDLKTFEVDLKTTLNLIDKIPKAKRKGLVVVSESGISSAKDVIILKEKGVDAVLIGEALLKAKDIREKIKELMGG